MIFFCFSTWVSTRVIFQILVITKIEFINVSNTFVSSLKRIIIKRAAGIMLFSSSHCGHFSSWELSHLIETCGKTIRYVLYVFYVDFRLLLCIHLCILWTFYAFVSSRNIYRNNECEKLASSEDMGIYIIFWQTVRLKWQMFVANGRMFVSKLIRPGCLRPSIALTVQNRGLKHQSFIHSKFLNETKHDTLL